MVKKKSARKRKNYGPFIYLVWIIITLFLHYFFISKINIDSTFQVAIDFAIVTLFSGWTGMFIEWIQKKKEIRGNKK